MRTIMSFLKRIINFLLFKWELLFNNIVKYQLDNPQQIPIIIINFNQLFNLKQQVDFYSKRGFKNIIVIDNHSSYEKLLAYYKHEKRIHVERMRQNLGSKVLFKEQSLLKKYCNGFYILTDADIIPNENLPETFILEMIKVLCANRAKYLKVGFALDLDSIPDYYPLKSKVLNWEKQFWKKRIADDIYEANIDTTFALYLPNYPIRAYKIDFFKAIRISGKYLAKHGGWYIDYENMSEEELYYQKTANRDGSWLLDEKRQLNSEFKNYYND